MENKFNIDDIENFLNQEMNATELAAFEKEMSTDKNLKAEVDFHSDVIKGIEGAAPLDFRKMVGNVHEEMKAESFFSASETEEVMEKTTQKEATVRNISLFRRLAIAASFALLLTAGWFLMNQQSSSPDQLFADNFAVHQDVLSLEIEDRLAETGFGTNKEALATLQKGMDTYKAGDYQSAIDQFNAFETTAPEDALATYANFYKAIALLKTEYVSDAQKVLEKIIEQTAFPLLDDAKWYLALIYLKQDNKQGATFLLRTLNLSDAYKERAAKLLEQII